MLIAVVAIVTILLLDASASGDTELPVPRVEDELVFNYAKGDLAVIRAQNDIALSHLRNALALLEGAPDATAIVHANHLTDLAYRLMRFAWHGTKLLDVSRGRAFRNPMYAIVADLNDESRRLIRHARLRLAQAARWTRNNAQDIQDAREMLSRALLLAEESQLLL